jgi:hypothetical protein
VKTPVAIAVIGAILIIAVKIWRSEAAVPFASDSLCTTIVGPAFIIPDESRETIAVRAGSVTDVTFLSLDTGHADGVRIPVKLPLLAVSMQQAPDALRLALRDRGGVRISSFDLTKCTENSTEIFDHIDAQLAIFGPDGNYLFGVTAKGFIFKVDTIEGKVEMLEAAATKANSLAVSHDSARLYVAGMGLTIVDTKSMTIESELTAEPNLLEVSAGPDGHTLALRNLKSIELFDLAKAGGEALASTVVDPMPNGASISTIGRLAFGPDGATLFYIKASDPESELLALSANDLHIVARMPIGPRPNAIAIVPDRGWVLLTTGHSGQEKLVTVNIETRKVVFESALSGPSSPSATGSSGCPRVH